MRKIFVQFAKKDVRLIYALALLFAVGVVMRLWHIEFGLPYSYHADEPEITEFAIKYTYEIRDVVKNNNWYKVVPISFVYGTLPTYLFTFATMVYSKTNGILGRTFSRADIYTALRILNSLIFSLIVPLGTYLYYKIFKDRHNVVLVSFLLALNWKLIVHSHYLNPDAITTLCLLCSYVTIYFYNEKKTDSLFTILSGIFFGLAIGTKVTAGLTLPLYLYMFLQKKDFRGMLAFSFIAFGAFAITNPFSLIFIDKFVFRIWIMKIKEAGLVFDSVNSNPLKYTEALGYMVTLPFLMISLYGNFVVASSKKGLTPIHKFLIGNILLYVIFFSLGSRRVDRWMLPVLPIVIMYAGYGFKKLLETLNEKKTLKNLIAALCIIQYLYFPGVLLVQFQKDTPRSAAYKWIEENLLPETNKYVITEEGLDPMNELPSTTVLKVNVYESENGQFVIPQSPEGYHYVILASRPMENFKKPEVQKTYSFFTDRWEKFENEVQDPSKFELIKSFELPEPNLIPLSNIYIYKNLNPIN